MKKSASPIGEVLKTVFARIESEKLFSKEDVDALWKRIAGESAFRHSRPASLRKKVLVVRVDSSGWLQELSMRKRELLKGLKRTLGKDKIFEIHFKVGEF